MNTFLFGCAVIWIYICLFVIFLTSTQELNLKKWQSNLLAIILGVAGGVLLLLL